MPIEEQTDSDSWVSIEKVNNRAYGQHLTIANREVTKLGFWLRKIGAPIGDVHFVIRHISDNSLISDVIWGAVTDLPTEKTYLEVEIPSPPTIDEEVFMGVEASDSSASNCPEARYQNSDVKENEYTRRNYQGTWSDITVRDFTYRYTYNGEVAPMLSSVGALADAGVI